MQPLDTNSPFSGSYDERQERYEHISELEWDRLQKLAAQHQALLDRTIFSAAYMYSRHNLEMEPTKFDERARRRYLITLAQTGLKTAAAQAAGVALPVVQQTVKADEAFAECVHEAMEEFRDSLEKEAIRRAVHGTAEPVVGRIGKDTDGIITYVVKYSDRLLELLLKKNILEYQDRMNIDMNVQGGVLVAHAPTTPVSWETTYGGQRQLPAVPLLDKVREELEKDQH